MYVSITSPNVIRKLIAVYIPSDLHMPSLCSPPVDVAIHKVLPEHQQRRVRTVRYRVDGFLEAYIDGFQRRREEQSIIFFQTWNWDAIASVFVFESG